MKKIQKLNSAGMSIIEIIIAMALFVIIASVGASAVLGGFSSNRLSDEHSRAHLFAQSGIESVASIVKQGWSAPFLATNCSTSCGVILNSGNWTWSGSNTTQNELTRTITVEPVLRDVSGDVVTAGGTDDPDTKRVVSTVTWSASPTRSNSVSITRYFTQFMKDIAAQIGDWTQPSVAGSVDLGGNDDALAVRVQGDYAYLVRSAGDPRFVVINISNPAAPSLVGSLAMNAANNTNLFVLGNYAYIVGSQNANELQIINISNPAAPSLAGTFNTPGNTDASGIFVVGTTAYVTTANSGNPELYILNVSNPAAVVQLGTLNLDGSALNVIVSGSYAFIGSSSNSQEIQVVNISNPAIPNLTTSLNLAGNDDAIGLSLIDNYLYTAQTSTVHIISVSNPASISLATSLAISGGNINAFSLEVANDQYLFVGTLNNSAEFVVLDISNPLSPIQAGIVDVSGNSPVRGVSYSDTYDIAVGASDSNNEEVIIFEPN